MSEFDWLSPARRITKKARAHGTPNLFAQASYEGVPVTLHYQKGRLIHQHFSKQQKQVLRASGVPLTWITPEYQTWGGFKPHDLFVHGVVVQRPTWCFIALSASKPNLIRMHTQSTTLQLLYARGFRTPIGYTGWPMTDQIDKAHLVEYVKKWRKWARVSQRKPTTQHPAMPEPIGMELFDDMNFKYAWN